MAQKYKGDGLVVLGINSWNEDKQAVSGFIKAGKLTYRNLLNGNSVSQQYKVTSVPTTFWIDRKGIIVDSEVGFSMFGASTLESKTKTLLKRK